jgi:hypothetical protein
LCSFVSGFFLLILVRLVRCQQILLSVDSFVTLLSVDSFVTLLSVDSFVTLLSVDSLVLLFCQRSLFVSSRRTYP